MPDTPRFRESVDYTDPQSTGWTAPITYDRHYSKREMSDVITSDYSSRRKAGEIIINPMSFSSVNHLLMDDQITYQRLSLGPIDIDVPPAASAHWMRAAIGYVPQTRNIDGALLTIDADNEIELRKQLALSFVDEPQYGFGEDLFEIKETIQFLRSPLASITKLLKAFDKDAVKALSLTKKGRVLSFSRRAEAIAGVWATYSFALAPLIRSLEDAIEALNDKSSLAFRRTSRSKGELFDSTTSKVSGYYPGINFFNIPQLTATAEIVKTSTVSFQAGLHYEATQHGTVTEKLGLRNKDLVVTAWEVIPMSFMLDRIISIKNSIKSFTNLVDPNVEILGGFVTRREEQTYSIQLVECDLADTRYDALTWSALPHVSQTFTYTREKWDPSITNALPLPNPVELVNSVSKVADLLALLTLTIFPLIRKYYVYNKVG